MLLMLIAILFVMISRESQRVATPKVDLCELNHVFVVTQAKDLSQAFSQVILWRWYSQWPTNTGYRVAEYCVTEDGVNIIWKQGKRRVVWRDRSGQQYEAICTSFRETATTYDPEMLERQEWPLGSRVPYFTK